MKQASSSNGKTGQAGERIAQHLLKCKGFRIEASNWRSGHMGEVDIIAYHAQDKVLAFVEVKSRKTASYGSPAEAVSPTKQGRIIQLANAYLSEHPQPDQVIVRFDVISVFYPGGGKAAEIEHIENAFH
jgi:putative endonuclease